MLETFVRASSPFAFQKAPYSEWLGFCGVWAEYAQENLSKREYRAERVRCLERDRLVSYHFCLNAA